MKKNVKLERNTYTELNTVDGKVSVLKIYGYKGVVTSTIVDTDKVELLKQHTWKYDKRMRRISNENNQNIRNVLYGPHDEGTYVISANKDYLDNRMENLLLAENRSAMCVYNAVQRRSSTGVKGVSRSGGNYFVSFKRLNHDVDILKKFNIATHGDKKAFELAVAYRKSLEEKYDN